MIIEEYMYYALVFGVPAAIFLIALLFAKMIKVQVISVILIMIGGAGAVGYYVYFDQQIAPDILAYYKAESCDKGTKAFYIPEDKTYGLPLGEKATLRIDKNQMSDDAIKRHWVIVENNAPNTLYVDAVAYTADESTDLVAPPGEEYVAYAVIAGETHSLRMPHDKTHFLEASPDEIPLSETEVKTGAWRYEILCR